MASANINDLWVQWLQIQLPFAFSGSSIVTDLAVSSGNVANANAVATLGGVPGKTTYITGFSASASGSTAGLAVTLTVAGPVNTLSYTFTFPVGVLVPGQPLNVTFARPIPAAALNTSIVVTLPAGGGGNTNASVSAYGYQL